MIVHSQSIRNSLFILSLDLLLHCQERLWKNQFDLTVRKDERFLLSLSLLLLELLNSVSLLNLLVSGLLTS